MRYLVITLLAVVCATGALFAQAPAPGGTMTIGAPAGSTLMVQTPKGLFALRAGVLAKYDIKTLTLGKLISFFGPAPEVPKEGADRAAMMKYWAEMQRRQAPAILIAKDNSLLLIIGDGFARVNQDTLLMEASADFSTPATAEAAGGQTMRMNEGAPGYMLIDNTLILMRSKEIISISITDGKFVRKPLPVELQPITVNFNMGGRGPGGGNREGRQPAEN